LTAAAGRPFFSDPRRYQPWLRRAAMLLAGVPALWLWYAGFTDQLGANPAETLIRGLGEWALRLLCLTLAVTPVRQLMGWPMLATWRRGLGLWTFAYAMQHLFAYAWLDMNLSVAEVWADVWQRPFILVGMVASFLLLLLAATSFNRAVRALGVRRWQALHRTVYGIALLALLHFFWMRAGKNDFTEVYAYALVLGSLLLWRVWYRWRRHPAQTA
jgi:methionine sulfoxide reductase heme-binding subunit